MNKVLRLILLSLFSLALAFQAQARDAKKKGRKTAVQSMNDEIDGELSDLDLQIQRRNNDSERERTQPARRPSSNVQPRGRTLAEQYQGRTIRRVPSSANQDVSGASPQVAMTAPTRVTFESYLHDNASHPAISRRPASMVMNQRAFVQPVLRTTITGSTLDANGVPLPAAAAGATPATPAPVGTNDVTPISGGTSGGDMPASGADAGQGSPLR